MGILERLAVIEKMLEALTGHFSNHLMHHWYFEMMLATAFVGLMAKGVWTLVTERRKAKEMRE